MMVVFLTVSAILPTITGCDGTDSGEAAKEPQPSRSASPSVSLPTTSKSRVTSEPPTTPTPSPSPPEMILSPTQPSPSVTAYLDPSSQVAMRGEEISVSIKAQASDQAITGSDLRMTFDPRVFQIVALSSDMVLGGDPVVGMDAKDNQNGILRYAVARRGHKSSQTNPETLAVIRFQVSASAGMGRHELSLESVTLTDERFNIIKEVSTQSGFVEIGG